MPAALAAFLDAFVLAASFAAAAAASSVLAGSDAWAARSVFDGALGAFLVLGPVARRHPRWDLALLAAGFASALLVLFAPDRVAGWVPPGTGGLVLVGLAVFLFPAARAARSLERVAGHPAPALAGGAAALLAVDTVIVRLLGWPGVAAVALAIASVVALAGRGVSGPAPSAGRGAAALCLALLAGVALGLVIDVSSRFAPQYLSDTRVSRALLGVILLAGIAVGTILSRRKKGLFGAAGLVVAPVFAALALASLAVARLPDAAREAIARGGALSEALVLAAVLGVPSLALGAAAAPARGRPVALVLLAVGISGGLHVRALAVPDALAERFVRRRGRDMVTEHSVERDGVYERIRSFDRPSGAVAHWNRDPLGRGAPFSGAERGEILGARFAVPEGRSLLVAGTPTEAHVAAIAAAGFSDSRRVDLVRSPVAGAPPLAESDLFRHAARGGAAYEAVVVLSRPFLAAGDGLRLTREGVRLLRRLLAPRGALVVWLDPVALPEGAAATALRTFFSEFPDGLLLASIDGLASPLFGLASRGTGPAGAAGAGGPIPLARGSDVIAALGPGPADSLLFPRLDATLPLRAVGTGPPDPGSLRGFARVVEPLSPDVAIALETLARVASASAGRANPFDVPIEALVIPDAAAVSLHEGLLLHPGSEALRGLAVACARALLAQKETDRLLEFGPRWVAAAPDEPALLLALGRQHLELLDEIHALPLLERAAALDPDSSEVRTSLGEAHREAGTKALDRGEKTTARSHLSRAAELLPADDARLEAALRRLGE